MDIEHLLFDYSTIAILTAIAKYGPISNVELKPLLDGQGYKIGKNSISFRTCALRKANLIKVTKVYLNKIMCGPPTLKYSKNFMSLSIVINLDGVKVIT